MIEIFWNNWMDDVSHVWVQLGIYLECSLFWICWLFKLGCLYTIHIRIVWLVHNCNAHFRRIQRDNRRNITYVFHPLMCLLPRKPHLLRQRIKRSVQETSVNGVDFIEHGHCFKHKFVQHFPERDSTILLLISVMLFLIHRLIQQDNPSWYP